VECLGHPYAYASDNVHVALVSHLHVLAPGLGSISAITPSSGSRLLSIVLGPEMSTNQGSNAKAIREPTFLRYHGVILCAAGRNHAVKRLATQFGAASILS
jgi:hypothetical protein